jgi:hypothetical protein
MNSPAQRVESSTEKNSLTTHTFLKEVKSACGRLLTTIFLIFSIFLIIQSIYAQEQWRVFTSQNSPLPSNLVWAIIVDRNNVKWVGTSEGIARIEGNDWQIYDTTNTPIRNNSIAPEAIDISNNIWFNVAYEGIAKYDGINWSIFDTTNSGLPTNFVFDISVDANNIKWIGTGGRGLAKFNDTSWVIYDTTNSGIPGNSPFSLYCDKNVKWVGMVNKGLGRYNDTSWITYNIFNSGLPGNWVRFVTVDYIGNIWIATDFSGLAKFNYSFNQWTVYNTTNSGIPSNELRPVLTDSYRKWIGTPGGGLAYYNDTDWTVFTPTNSPLPGYGVFGLGLDSNRNLWICCSGGLAIYNPNGILGIKSNSQNFPLNFVLYQNYPNPFNPLTTIKYELPKDVFISFKIYDILGREIYSINEFKKAGVYDVKFDGSNYASGIYFYRLEAGSFIETKKMVLVK